MIAALLMLAVTWAADVGVPLPLTLLTNDQGVAAVLAPGPVRVVNLWASWCGPCRAELPLFDALATRLGTDAEVVLVSVDTSRPRAVALAKRLDLHARVLFDGESFAAQINPEAMPSTLLVGSDGVVRRVVAGEMNVDDVAALEGEVRALIVDDKPRQSVDSPLK